MITKKSIYLFLLFVLLATACAPSLAKIEEPGPPDPADQPTQSETVSDDVHPAETSIPSTAIPEPTDEGTLELSTDLERGCDRNDGTDPELRRVTRRSSFP